MNRMDRRLTGVLLIETLILVSTPGSLTAQEPLLKTLADIGVIIPPDQHTPLAPPVVIGVDENTTPEALAGRLGWQRFSKPTAVAPIWMDLNYIQDAAGKRVGHEVHFRFVVHAGFDQLRDKDLMQDVFGGAEENDSQEGSFREIDADELTRSGITVDPRASYGLVEVPLMNRVVLRGVIAAETTDIDGVHVMAWRLLPTPGLDEQAELATTWAPLRRDDLGQKVQGDALPYSGAGGYLALQSLAEVSPELSGACLVEGRMVLHEPQGWFGGSNFLRSKFPLLIQEAVRKFRRGLE